MNRFQMHAACALGGACEKNKTSDIVECRFFFLRGLQDRALVTKSINRSWMLGVNSKMLAHPNLLFLRHLPIALGCC